MPKSPGAGGETRSFDVEDRLVRILDEAALAAVVPQLPPETLHRLMRHRGLEGCGPLLSSATPEQLRAVLDLDLWTPAPPGLDARFDAGRFAAWIETLVEADAEGAARIVAAMDTEVVVAGLSRYVRVFDVAALLPPSMEDLELPGDPASDALTLEVGGYAVRARRPESWDAIVILLASLAGEHPAVFDAVMRGCRRLSDSAPEIDGLDELLPASGQLLYGLAVGREDRKTALGYVTPADARAFLQMARKAPVTPAGSSRPVNPIAAAFLGAVEAAEDEVAGPPPAATTPAPASQDAPETARRIAELLDQLDAERPQPRALLADPGDAPAGLTRIRPLMEHLRDHDPDAYSTRSRELAFLANALVSGCSLQSRSLTPREGMDAAIAACNLGLERYDTPIADAFLADHDLLAPFEAGWSVLFDQVSTLVSRSLLRTLDDLHPADAPTRAGLRTLGRQLAKQCEAGTPWKARDALDVLDVLATLDVAVWTSLLGLLDECPAIPAAMTAILESRRGAISATAFEFISTTSQLDAVRRFAAELPGRLRG
jgi:hypothetical protein